MDGTLDEKLWPKEFPTPRAHAEQWAEARFLGEFIAERFGEQNPPGDVGVIIETRTYDIDWQFHRRDLCIFKDISYEGSRVRIKYKGKEVFYDDTATSSGVPIILTYKAGEWEEELRNLYKTLKKQR